VRCAAGLATHRVVGARDSKRDCSLFFTSCGSTVLRGRDLTWLDQYPKAVDAVTLQQVNAAIKQHLNPEKMMILKTGTLPTSLASIFITNNFRILM